MDLYEFVKESNRIEGIIRPPLHDELNATHELVHLPTISIAHLQTFVSACEPLAALRDTVGLDVRVGDYVAPAGGPSIRDRLALLLATAYEVDDPWSTHIAYELLHPFLDCNGRSGRALWAWQMLRHGHDLSLGFLHLFYYQTLERS